MTPEQELAAFEAWAMYKADLRKGSAGEYVDIFARVMLDAWQARAAIEAERQAMRWPADFDGAHHVAEPEPVTQTPQTCPDCAGSGANQNGSDWDCCDTCKGRKVT